MSPNEHINEVIVLKLTLHDKLVGYLAGFQNGRNVLSFANEFKDDPARPTFSLITHPNFPNSKKLMTEPAYSGEVEHLFWFKLNTIFSTHHVVAFLPQVFILSQVRHYFSHGLTLECHAMSIVH